MFTFGIRTLMIAALAQRTSCFVNLASRGGSLVRTAERGHSLVTSNVRRVPVSHVSRSRSCALGMKVEMGPDETVKKYGLEAGLFQAFKSGRKEGEGTEGAATTAKDLLKQYGSAYLITSITLSLISFSICYVAVSNGVDMAALLSKVGIETSTSAETTGVVAVAYAIHKAASPVRFPPTVALTPVVANFLGKGNDESTDPDSGEE